MKQPGEALKMKNVMKHPEEALRAAEALARRGDARAAAPLLALLGLLKTDSDRKSVATALEELLRTGAASLPDAILTQLADLADGEMFVSHHVERREVYDGVFEGGHNETSSVPMSRAAIRELARQELARRGDARKEEKGPS